MKKPSALLASLLVPTMAVALGALSCAGGETAGSTGTGSTTGSSGGSSGTATGGRSGTGTGGSSFGSGGSTFTSGGSTGAGTGGRVNSGGSTFSSGGSTGAGTGGRANTGGSTFGTGGSTGAGTGGTPVSTGALTVTAGFVTSGTWKGYGYTFVGPMPPAATTATVSPMNFMTATQLCASGMIAPDTSYNSVAGMGFSVNQEMATTATSPPTNTIATSGTGLLVNVGSVTGLTLAMGSGSQLRAQVKTATADYCAPLAASGTSMIPWGMFNTMCWSTSGGAAFTAGTAIKAVELVIPSSAAATIGPFNMCLVDARPY